MKYNLQSLQKYFTVAAI